MNEWKEDKKRRKVEKQTELMKWHAFKRQGDGFVDVIGTSVN
jgi:hypothetical protein